MSALATTVLPGDATMIPNIISPDNTAPLIIDMIDRKNLVRELYQKKLLIKVFNAWCSIVERD